MNQIDEIMKDPFYGESKHYKYLLNIEYNAFEEHILCGNGCHITRVKKTKKLTKEEIYNFYLNSIENNDLVYYTLFCDFNLTERKKIKNIDYYDSIQSIHAVGVKQKFKELLGYVFKDLV